MAAPIIGVTANYNPPEKGGQFGSMTLGESYIQAILRAGGLPVILPVGLSPDQLRDLFARLDGVLLTGGSDVDPQRFGGAPHPRVYGIDPLRDDLEIRLVRMAAEDGKPFLGICRGVQVINVALGGTLYTDIGDQMDGSLRHDWYPDIARDYLAHAVTLTPESELAKVLGGAAFQVNSLHHQGLQQVAPSLRAVAFAPDQLVEGVEIPGHPFAFGVQWHPEWLQEHAPQRLLFQALIQASSRNGR